MSPTSGVTPDMTAATRRRTYSSDARTCGGTINPHKGERMFESSLDLFQSVTPILELIDLILGVG